MLSAKHQRPLIKAGLVIWALWIFINYFIHHPAYYYALADAPYPRLIFLLGIFCTGLFFLHRSLKFKIRGWQVYSFMLLSMLMIFHAFAQEASIYDGSALARMFYFLLNTLLLHLGGLFIFSLCCIAGIKLLKPFEPILNLHHKNILGLSLGMAIITLFLFLLAALGFLINWLVIGGAILLVLWQRKAFLDFIKYIFWRPILENTTTWGFPLLALVSIFISLNLVGAIKVFPLGFDGAILYQNTSKLLWESQALLKGGQAYNWSLFTSIGPLLFGKMSYSIFLSHAACILCAWALYHLSRIFLSTKYAWLAIAIFFTLPAINFHSFVDEKVDLAFLFISLSILILLVKYGQHIAFNYGQSNKESLYFMSLLGFLTAYAMGVKYTAVFLVISLLCIFTYHWAGIKGFIGTLLLGIALLFLGNVNSVGYLDIDNTQRLWIIAVSGLAGLSFFAVACKNQAQLNTLAYLKNIAYFCLVFSLSFGPWLGKNLIESKSLSPKNLLYGKTEKEQLRINYSWLKDNNIPFLLLAADKKIMRQQLQEQGLNPVESNDLAFYNQWEGIRNKALKKDLKNQKKQRPKQNSSKREEIQRYLGYESGLPQYLSLPFDLTMNTNVPNKRGLDIGFLFLLFLPLLLLNFKTQAFFNLKNSLVLIALFLIFLLSWNANIMEGGQRKNLETHLSNYVYGPSKSLSEMGREIYQPFLGLQDNLSRLTEVLFDWSSNVDFIFIPFLLLLIGLGFYQSGKDNWKQLPIALKTLTVLSLSFGFLWWILGNGITYYALIMWATLALLIVYYIEQISLFSDKKLIPFFNSWLSSILVVFLFFNLLLHFTNSSNNWKNSSNLFFSPFIKHSSESILSEETFYKKEFPIVQEVKDSLNTNHTAKIYQVGTFLKYHLSNNQQRVYVDNQLGMFDKTSKILQNPDDFLLALKLKGFEYIIFDLNIVKMDQTPEKSLVEKANKFVQVLNNQQRVRLLLTDNKVRVTDPKTKQVKEGYGLRGKLVERGTLAIFKLR